jgi:hypothetical protein
LGIDKRKCATWQIEAAGRLYAVGVSELPDYITVSPVTLLCHRCKAEPGSVCETLKGATELVHIERIKAALALDVEAKREIESRPKRNPNDL